MIIYDKDECPFCYRVRLCLAALGLAYERRSHESDERWRQLTRAATVPVFVDGDLVLTDSAIILEYLADRFTSLLAGSPLERARQRELVRYADVPIGRAIREVIFEKRASGKADWDLQRIAKGRAAYLEALPALEGQLVGRAFFGGDHYSIADAALTSRFALADGYGVPLSEETPNLRRYYAARVGDAFFADASPRVVVQSTQIDLDN